MKKLSSFLQKKTLIEKICLGGIVLIGFLSVGLLYHQYSCFKSASSRLLELKEDYRLYTLALKKVLNEKTQIVAGSKDDSAKKKIEIQEPNDYYGWPRAVDSSAIVSSDEFLQTFSPINRDISYLKSEAIEFARSFKLEEQVAHLFEVPEWKRYKKQEKFVPRKKDTQKRIIGTTSRMRSLRGSEHYGPKDFTFLWPIDRSKFWLSSLFGPRKMKNRGWRYHYGIDMAALKGTPVYAAASGIVLESGWNNGYGNYILIAHNRKYRSRYAHLSKRKVKIGQKVSRGQIIGAVGDTGLVRKSGKDASHLHFEVYAFGRHINPISVLA